MAVANSLNECSRSGNGCRHQSSYSLYLFIYSSEATKGSELFTDSLQVNLETVN
jgi:hypothetical protein